VLHDIGDALITEPISDFAALPNRTERRAGGDAGCIAPRPQSLLWAGDRAAHNSDGRALAFLVRLAPADGDPDARRAFLDVLAIERPELGAPEGAGKAKQQRAVTWATSIRSPRPWTKLSAPWLVAASIAR
jgi:hypothetical protein